MNWRVQLAKDLQRHEGLRYKSYYDAVGGCWTIGYGHTGPEVVRGLTWSMAQVLEALERDIETAIETARSLFPGFDLLSKARKTVLANMAFNLGYHRLKGFKKLRVAVAVEDWNKAALEMVNSRWYVQVKSRGSELVQRMISDRVASQHQI